MKKSTKKAMKKAEVRPRGEQAFAVKRDITECKQAESREAAIEAMRKSEKYFKEITENSSDIIIITDKNGDIKYCSPSIERFTGYKPEELIGKNAIKLIHPDDKKRAVDDFGKAILTTDSAIPNAFRIVHKDGSEHYFEGLGKNLLDNPSVTGFIMNVRDITEHKRAEAALHQSEEKYRSIIENMQEGYFELDLAGNLTFVNDAECTNMGYSREELIGMNNRQYQDKANAQKMYQLFKRLYKTGEPVKASDIEIIRKNGTKGFDEISASLIRDAEGKPIGFRGISRDVTEHRRLEAVLKEAKMFTESALNSIADIFYSFDLRGKLLSWNKAFNRISGYSDQELFSKKSTDFFLGEDLQRIAEAIERTYKEGTSRVEANFVLKDGRQILCEFNSSVLKDSNGTIIGFSGTGRDITERKKTENAVKESEARFRGIVIWSEDAIIVTDAKGKIEFMNPTAGIVFNRNVDSFIGTDFGLPLVNGESTEIDIFRPGKDPGVGDMCVGETEWLGEKAHLITIHDITERKQIEEKIKKAQETLFIMNNRLEERNCQNSLLSEMRELLQSCSTVQEMPTIVVSYVAKLFPGTDGALFLLSDSKTHLQSVARWGDFPEDVDNNIFAPDACWGLRQGRVYAVDDMKTGPICPHLKQPSSSAYICLPLIGKGEIPGLLHLGTKQSVPEDDRQGTIVELKEVAVMFAEYLSLSIANIKLSEKLTSQSIRDPLTGLYNRRYMEETIQHEILRAARKKTKIGIVMVDIDHFKQINDTYGHDAGDELLVKLADFFKLKTRVSDFIFRYGGEEFMLVLPESSVEDTYKRADSIRKEIKNMKVHFRGQLLPQITLSFGVDAYPDHGLDLTELVRVVDKALYTAKEEGRDKVIIA